MTSHTRMKAGSNPAPSDTGFKREGSVASTPRAFTAAPNALRCKQDITLRDGSGAQCMRAARRDGLCIQHYRIAQASKCDCQAPDAVGVKLVSMSCPVHNDLLPDEKETP